MSSHPQPYNSRREWSRVAICMLFLLRWVCSCSGDSTLGRKVGGRLNNQDDVQLRIHDRKVVLDNGIAEISFSKPDGDVIGINYNGIDNLLEVKNALSNRGYWDIVWGSPNDHRGKYDRVSGTTFKVVEQTRDSVEVSFVRGWTSSSAETIAPLIVDKRFILRRRVSGLYSYAIFEHPQGWPAIGIGDLRIVFKLNGEKFHFMSVSDTRQRVMPTAHDRDTGRVLGYAEAVLLTNPSNPLLKGEVDDKYQYSTENQDNRVHGWICDYPAAGFWMITPSNEFRSAGPVKQDLTSHVGPTNLNMFVSNHYAGKGVGVALRNGEEWKKVFGPFLVYLNSNGPRDRLWEDAKRQMMVETESWPYSFVHSPDFPTADQRGTISGQMLVRDRFVNDTDIPASCAYVGLAAPGEVGSWQTESNGYQFWTRADASGSFTIKNVRPGTYSLYAWVPGFLGDYKYGVDVKVAPGSNIKVETLVFNPPRNGPTLWEIGIPDRTAAEFYVPPPNPFLQNKVLQNSSQDYFRQYGLWERYTELYPKSDLVYTVGVSDHRKDWFFAHVTRSTGKSTYVPATWQIRFNLDNINYGGRYTLQIAVASATQSHLQMWFNKPSTRHAHFESGGFGSDNAIARHGIHGLYRMFSFDVPSYLLRRGENTLYISQLHSESPFQGVMYDYIRLEGPSRTGY